MQTGQRATTTIASGATTTIASGATIRAMAPGIVMPMPMSMRRPRLRAPGGP